MREQIVRVVVVQPPFYVTVITLVAGIAVAVATFLLWRATHRLREATDRVREATERSYTPTLAIADAEANWDPGSQELRFEALIVNLSSSSLATVISHFLADVGVAGSAREQRSRIDKRATLKHPRLIRSRTHVGRKKGWLVDAGGVQTLALVVDSFRAEELPENASVQLKLYYAERGAKRYWEWREREDALLGSTKVEATVQKRRLPIDPKKRREPPKEPPLRQRL